MVDLHAIRALGIAAVLMGFPAHPARATTAPVTVCFDEREQSVYLHPEDGNRVGGATAALVREAFRRAGIELRFLPLPWGRCLREAAAFAQQPGQPEAVMYASPNDERMQRFHFSAPLHLQHGGVWYRPSQWPAGPALTRLPDLGQYRLCGMAHHNYGWLTSLGITVQDTGAPNLQAAMVKLRQDRCDLVLSSLEGVRDSEASGRLPRDEDRAFVPFPNHPPASHHLLWSRQSARAATLLPAFNAALAQMRADGSARRLYRQHKANADPVPAQVPDAAQKL